MQTTKQALCMTKWSSMFIEAEGIECNSSCGEGFIQTVLTYPVVAFTVLNKYSINMHWIIR